MATNRSSRIAAAAALTIAAVVGIQLVNAGTASAQCVGYWAGAAGVADPNTGQPLALETAVPGTCNNDGTYTATLSAAQGWTPVLWNRDGNPGNPFNPWGAWSQWYDTGIVSYVAAHHESREFLCAVNDSNGSAWCGLGTSVSRRLRRNGEHQVDGNAEHPDRHGCASRDHTGRSDGLLPQLHAGRAGDRHRLLSA